ncbi:pilus assembly protein PilX [Variovorax sp. PBL-E5]|uniref:pilus assembly protein PilX n=1 Tax=Variovorax sp. PBL-E5 TaxID=434014 RepID=UPI001317DB2C|nr:pilus assembly protein PilX [Variovorax sp. PBL-E5]VTU40100.1 hypothetical protein E5CHR_05347 [Variovorax sp. PBL-E5]
MHMHASIARSRGSAQRGISLLFALLALVALSLGTLALVRSVDTGSLLLGNIGFKQDATAAADQAARQAIDWLTLNNASLNTDLATSGYYASTQELAADGVTIKPPVDVTGQMLAGTANRQLVDWDANNCKAAASGSYTGCTLLPASIAAAINGNQASYIVFRLCSKPGDFTTDTSITCAQLATSAPACGSKGALDYGGGAPLPCATSSTYYRIVVRVLGARNTASFTETIVHF